MTENGHKEGCPKQSSLKNEFGDLDEREPLRCAGNVPTLTDVFLAFGLLGFKAFGGHESHVKLLREEFVEKRQWIEEGAFQDLQRLGQAIPGPASVQLGVAIAATAAGPAAGLLACVMFVWPGFILALLLALAVWLILYHDPYAMMPALFNPGGPFIPVAPVAGLMSKAAVGVSPTGLAILSFSAFQTARQVSLEGVPAAIAMSSGLITLLLPPYLASWGLPALFFCGCAVALIDSVFFQFLETDDQHYAASASEGLNAWRDETNTSLPPDTLWAVTGVTLAHCVLLIGAWMAIFVAAGVGRHVIFRQEVLTVFDLFLRAGSFTWGNEYVVLAGLTLELVEAGHLPCHVFLASLALVRLVPGHSFNVGVFVGGLLAGPAGALVAGLGVYLPGLLFGLASLGVPAKIQRHRLTQAAAAGLNAVSLGVLLAIVARLFLRGVHTPGPVCVTAACLCLMGLFPVPAPLVLLSGGAFGWLLYQANIGGPYCWVADFVTQFPQYNDICLLWCNYQEKLLP